MFKHHTLVHLICFRLFLFLRFTPSDKTTREESDNTILLANDKTNLFWFCFFNSMACSISVDDEQQVIFDALWQVYRKYDQEESQAAANKKGVLSIIQDLQNVYSCTQPNNHKPSRFETNKRKTTSARDQPQRLSNGRIYYPTFEYKLVEENEHGMRYEMRTPAYNERNAWATVNVKQTEDGQTMLCVMLRTRIHTHLFVFFS